MISQRTQTPQEEFWQGAFGNEYTARNLVSAQQRQPFFAKILDRTGKIKTVCELGANKGHNLQALLGLDPALKVTGIEVNEMAYQHLTQLAGVEAIRSAIQDFKPNRKFDLVFTCGVLIHIPPNHLPLVYQTLIDASDRYILINEYFNPQPVEISYRGHEEKLFKRDFGSDIMDQFQGQLEIVDYGFLWRRQEPSWDDTVWVLFKKIGNQVETTEGNES